MDYLQREALVRAKAQPGRPLDVSGPGRTSMDLARPGGQTSKLETLTDWSAYLEENAQPVGYQALEESTRFPLANPLSVHIVQVAVVATDASFRILSSILRGGQSGRSAPRI